MLVMQFAAYPSFLKVLINDVDLNPLHHGNIYLTTPNLYRLYGKIKLSAYCLLIYVFIKW